LFHYFKNRLLNVSDLPAGVYFATVIAKRKKVWSEKVVVSPLIFSFLVGVPHRSYKKE